MREVGFEFSVKGFDIYYDSGTLTCSSGCDYDGVYNSCPQNKMIPVNMNAGSCYAQCLGGTNCSTCPENTYYTHKELGQREDTRNCTFCDSGKYIIGRLNATDHASQDDCDACTVGSFLYKGTVCLTCGPGT